MPDIQTQSADGVTHSFPDGTKPEVIDRVMKEYAQSKIPGVPSSGLPQPAKPIPAGLQGKSTFAERLNAGSNPGSFEGHPENIGEYVPRTIGEAAGGVADIAGGRSARGTHRIIGAAGNALMPVGALAAGGAPLATGLSLAAGYTGGKLLRGGAEAIGANPDQADVAEDVGNIAGGYAGAKATPFVRGVPGAIGNQLRGDAISPNSPGYNVLNPSVNKVASVVKWPVSGASLADAIVPNRSGGPAGLFSNVSNRFSPKQIDALTPFKPTAIEPGAPLPSAEDFYARQGAEQNAIFKRGTGAQDAGRSASNSSSLFPQPLRPLVGTPEDWATYEQQMGILRPEASDAGVYHAARGASSKKLNLQERLGKKILQ